MRVVAVRWRDHSSMSPRGRWTSAEEVRELMPAVGLSVGAVLVDMPDRLVIAAHMVETDIGGDLCLPRENIISVQELGDIEWKETDHA